jgi:hypothetical protein
VEYGFGEIKNFRFVPEGTIVAPRQVPGGAAPLPYMPGFEEGGGDPGWDNAGFGARLDYDSAPLPARTDRSAAHPRP